MGDEHIHSPFGKPGRLFSVDAVMLLETSESVSFQIRHAEVLIWLAECFASVLFSYDMPAIKIAGVAFG